MPWEVEFTDEFEAWWESLDETDQIKLDAAVRLLEEYGPDLPFPFSSGVNSRHSHMRELRVQAHGKPLRVLYAFDSRRTAILLLAGDKTGDRRWYEVHVPIAERVYDRHVEDMKKETKKPKKE